MTNQDLDTILYVLKIPRGHVLPHTLQVGDVKMLAHYSSIVELPDGGISIRWDILDVLGPPEARAEFQARMKK